MKKKSTAEKLLAAAVLILTAGCIDVDYVGQSFPALPAGSNVTIYTPESPLSDRSYRAIGRVSITAPEGTTRGEINEKLTVLAREHGADTVNIISVRRVVIGPGAPDTSMAAQPTWNRDARNMGGNYIYSNNFGQSNVNPPVSNITEWQIKALLMVTEEKFQAMKELYNKQRVKLDELSGGAAVAAPAASAGVALDQAAQSVDVPPAKPVEKTVKSAPKPLKLELGAGPGQTVIL